MKLPYTELSHLGMQGICIILDQAVCPTVCSDQQRLSIVLGKPYHLRPIILSGDAKDWKWDILHANYGLCHLARVHLHPTHHHIFRQCLVTVGYRILALGGPLADTAELLLCSWYPCPPHFASGLAVMQRIVPLSNMEGFGVIAHLIIRSHIWKTDALLLALTYVGKQKQAGL